MNAYKAWDKHNSEGYGTVGFSANRSEFASCVCDACHVTTFVTILTMPETKVQADGTLRTIYKKLWLCDSCRDRLYAALGQARLTSAR